MGTYLLNGIVTERGVSKKHIRSAYIQAQHIAKVLHVNLDYYDAFEDETEYSWKIKPTVLEGKILAAFLDAQF